MEEKGDGEDYLGNEVIYGEFGTENERAIPGLAN